MTIDKINALYNAAVEQDERGVKGAMFKSPNLNVKVKALHVDAVIPKYAHEGDAGFDLVAVEDTVIEPGETKLVKTGLAFALPSGYEMQIRPRSGITLKTKLRVQLGTVDSNYRGEVGVIVDNTFENPFETIGYYPLSTKGETLPRQSQAYLDGSYFIKKGDRIAQAVLNAIPTVSLETVTELDETTRGQGGFGSSGVSSSDNLADEELADRLQRDKGRD